MDTETTQRILEELVPTFERLETQSAAVVHFLKAKGIANDEELAPYLEQAANASSIRWGAIPLRMARLLASVQKNTENASEVNKFKAEEAATKEGDKTTNEPDQAAQEDSKAETHTAEENAEPSKHSESNEKETDKKDKKDKKSRTDRDPSEQPKNDNQTTAGKDLVKTKKETAAEKMDGDVESHRAGAERKPSEEEAETENHQRATRTRKSA
jgi:hypothetical protein